MLVMYNRFHNYDADILLKINEGGRFTLPDTKTKEEKSKALAKQDNDLFNTARLFVPLPHPVNYLANDKIQHRRRTLYQHLPT